MFDRERIACGHFDVMHLRIFRDVRISLLPGRQGLSRPQGLVFMGKVLSGVQRRSKCDYAFPQD